MKRLISLIVTLIVISGTLFAQKNIQRPSKVSKSNNSTIRSNPVIDRLISNMVYVEGGSFMMGSDDDDSYDDEIPVHIENINSFHIGKYEVTQQEWQAIMGNNPSQFAGDKNRPVENVSWDDCQKFIRKLNAMTGKKFRLPTEAEWEYAARGGNLSKNFVYSGSNNLNDVGSYCRNSGHMPSIVGDKSANELGIYDMSGNVCEWTSDFYSDDYSKSRNSADKVCRGGSWHHYATGCRTTCRHACSQTSRFDFLGLRLAL